MRKLIFCTFLFMSIGGYSSVTINNKNSETQEKNELLIEEETNNEKKTLQKQSSFNIDYQFIENGYGIGFGLAWKHLLINMSLKNGETKSPVTKNSGWDAGIGGHYRFWFKDLLFLDADLGIRYSKWNIEYSIKKEVGGHRTPAGVYIPEYEYDKTSQSTDNFGLFVSPKIGINLYKGTSVVASYRWDFHEFKFNKDYISDYFSIGLIFVW